jgi:hypothetical protein
MASIRKRRGKVQVQIRRAGHRPISKTFILRKDALEWARDAERQADRVLASCTAGRGNGTVQSRKAILFLAME